MDDDLTPLSVFISCFSIAALCGFFTHLRSGAPLLAREVIAVTFYSGFIGLVIGLMWFRYFSPGNLYFLIGVSGLAGLGGTTMSAAIIKRLQKAAFNLPMDDDKDNDHDKRTS